MAITDGTSGSGQPPGTRVRLGGRTITVGDVARLDDGTMAGSVATMDVVFQRLVTQVGMDLVSAATVCATTPARTMGLAGCGLLAAGAPADLAILDRQLNVVETWIGGRRVWGPHGPAA
jgi:N-acetylglucosamine-6-phosphate deacetylase